MKSLEKATQLFVRSSTSRYCAKRIRLGYIEGIKHNFFKEISLDPPLITLSFFGIFFQIPNIKALDSSWYYHFFIKKLHSPLRHF